MIEFYISTLKVKFSVITWHFSHQKNGRFYGNFFVRFFALSENV